MRGGFVVIRRKKDRAGADKAPNISDRISVNPALDFMVDAILFR